MKRKEIFSCIPRVYDYRAGFTLVELAIVLVVVSLLLVALLGPLAAQQEQKSIMDTRKQLDEAREALFGYLLTNGRLPCPSDPALISSNANAGVARATCATVALAEGVLPWRTLGIRETDAWSHRFTYRVSLPFGSNAITTPIATNTAGDIDIRDKAVAGTLLIPAAQVAAVVISHGKHADGAWLSGGTKLPDSTDADEAENSNTDQRYVDHSNTALSPNSAYDDMLVWLPASLVYSKLLAVGRLP